jgi:limonene-1,2-epoxide hydrolase
MSDAPDARRRTRDPEVGSSRAVHPFRAAIEARDLDAVSALLADDVEFRSPIVFKPYRGRDAATMLLRAVSQVFEDFSYVREIGAPDARDHALVFQARVGERQIEGCDFLHLDDDGLIDEFVVMVRPLSAAHALRDAMAAQLAALGGES